MVKDLKRSAMAEADAAGAMQPTIEEEDEDVPSKEIILKTGLLSFPKIKTPQQRSRKYLQSKQANVFGNILSYTHLKI